MCYGSRSESTVRGARYETEMTTLVHTLRQRSTTQTLDQVRNTCRSDTHGMCKHACTRRIPTSDGLRQDRSSLHMRSAQTSPTASVVRAVFLRRHRNHAHLLMSAPSAASGHNPSVPTGVETSSTATDRETDAQVPVYLLRCQVICCVNSVSAVH